MVSKAEIRRERQLDALISAAESRIKANGLAGVKARELANDIGIAVGAIYNLVADLDELILRVNVHTMNRLDAALLEARLSPRFPPERTPPGGLSPLGSPIAGLLSKTCGYGAISLSIPRRRGRLFPIGLRAKTFILSATFANPCAS